MLGRYGDNLDVYRPHFYIGILFEGWFNREAVRNREGGAGDDCEQFLAYCFVSAFPEFHVY